jgi:myo-inositol-1(or 4)-monophosphatase
VLAVVKDPFRIEIFVAEKGKGAMCGDVPLRVNQRKTLGNALVGSVLPNVKNAAFPMAWSAFSALVHSCGQVRRTGSAVLDLAYVAAGRLDGFVVLSLRKWDIAAGALLVQEAGGVCLDAQGGNAFLAKEQVVAGNADLAPALVNALKSAP